MTDPIVLSVITKMQERSKVGILKYGLTLADNPLPRLQWLRHAQEEAMDLANYLEVLIQQEEMSRIGQNGNDGEHYQELKPTPFQGRITLRQLHEIWPTP